MIGYLYAFISSLFFSFYVVPRKFSSLPPLVFSLLMSVGFFIGSIIIFFISHTTETISPVLFWSVLAGVVWAISFVAFVQSPDVIGLARSNQWKNLQGPIGVFLSLIILKEYLHINPVFALLAGLAIFLAAVVLTVASKRETQKQKLRGILMATASAIGFGSVTVINKFVTTYSGVYAQQVVWSFSIMTSLFVALFIREKGKIFRLRLTKSQFALSLSAGLLYLGASFFMLQSYRFISASIGFTIIQLNTLWTLALGVFVFHEIDIRKHAKNIAAGIFLSILGIVFLSMARI